MGGGIDFEQREPEGEFRRVGEYPEVAGPERIRGLFQC
jgi:hypothetical protein